MAPPPATPIDDLMAFLDGSPSPFHAVRSAATRLTEAGFEALDDADNWNTIPDAGFVTRGGAAVAWKLGTASPQASLRLVGAHTDSPTLRIKPVPTMDRFGWDMLNVEVYGGALYNSWLDRDLGLAGRITLPGGENRLVFADRPVARVPQLAIHLDPTANDGLALNPQEHLRPIWATGGAPDFAQWLGELADCAPPISWEIGLVELQPAAIIGADRSLLASGRIDDQLSCWAAISAIIAAQPTQRASIIVLNDHEEVGSWSATGAAGGWLERVLERLAIGRGATRAEHLASMASAQMASADGAHAIHPNYPERHDPSHAPMVNGGPVIKVNTKQRYATTSETSAAFISACEAAGVGYQWFVSRNDMRCGTTIGPITATRLGVDVVDVGAAQLSMHSAREVCGVDDGPALRDALVEWLSA